MRIKISEVLIKDKDSGHNCGRYIVNFHCLIEEAFKAMKTMPEYHIDGQYNMVIQLHNGWTNLT